MWFRKFGRLNPFALRRSFARPPGEPPKLAVVTCIKNEGEDLVEWLCFHRHIGVSRFVIYDNLSTDATARILAAVPFRDTITVHRAAAPTDPQKQALRDAIRRYRYALDWVAFIDGDEYLVPLDDVPLAQKLAALEDDGIDAYGVHWRIFGSAGYAERPPGLLTESFTRRAPDEVKENRHIKTLARMAKVTSMSTVHYFPVAGVFRLDDGSRPAGDFQGVGATTSFRCAIAIHHYITKSRAQCMTKIARGRPLVRKTGQVFRPASYFDSNDHNEVEDDRAAKIIAPIRDEVLALRDTIGRD